VRRARAPLRYKRAGRALLCAVATRRRTLEAYVPIGAVLGGLPRGAGTGATAPLWRRLRWDGVQSADDLLRPSASQEDLGKPPGTDCGGVYTSPPAISGSRPSSLATRSENRQPDVDLIRKDRWSVRSLPAGARVAAENVTRGPSPASMKAPRPGAEIAQRPHRLIIDRLPVSNEGWKSHKLQPS